MDRTEAYRALNNLLVKTFNRILGIEENVLCRNEFCDLTIREMHVLEAIDETTRDTEATMTVVAEKLSITTGTLTVAVNQLVKKKYVIRARNEADRRIVLLSLTQKGRQALKVHEQFHRDMVENILKSLNDDQLESLMQAIDQITRYFNDYCPCKEPKSSHAKNESK